MTQPNERSSVSQDGFSEHSLEESGPGLSPVPYSEEQTELFQRRYDNGYNIYDDQTYVSWLQQQHPDDLPENLSSSTVLETQVNGEQAEPPNCNTSTERDSTADKENVVPSPEQPMDSAADKKNVVPSPQQLTYSLSASLANTRVFVSELREILGERRVVSKTSTKSKSTARVLASAESLALLIEKEKKNKKRNRKQREKRSEIENDKRKKKKRKAESRRKKDEERAKQRAQKHKRSTNKTQKAPVVAELSSDSEIEDEDQYSVQDKDISSNECAICFGLYQDDLSSAGNLMREWVECTNEWCKKWMHSQCLQVNNDLYVCGICKIT